MRSRLAVFVIPLALVGCKSKDGANNGSDDSGQEASDRPDFAGVWLLRIPYGQFDGSSCTNTLVHNFVAAYEEVDEEVESDWTQSSDASRSDALYFVQVETLGADGAVMLLNDDILPGTLSGDTWTFTWQKRSETSEGLEHNTRYSYSERISSQTAVTLAVRFEGDTATGTWSVTATSEQGWEESDEWLDTEVGYSSGQIPSAAWLVEDSGALGASPVINWSNEGDCEAVICSLTLTQTCSQSAGVSMERTGYEDEESYGFLDDISQPFGNGS